MVTCVATDAEGRVTYLGDQGNHALPVSETMALTTSINGASAFMRVRTDEGYTSLFSVVDDLIEEMEFIGASDTSLDHIKDSLDHLSINTTKIGALINKAETQKEAITQREMVITEALSGMEDADISSLVTEMQSLIVSRDAAQQSFVMIGQQNLFDFLR